MRVITVFATASTNRTPERWSRCGRKRSDEIWDGSSHSPCLMHSLYAAGLPVPQTYSLTRNVLVMEFLGENGWPAPRLKDVELTKKSYDRVYKRLILILREMYQKCRLVHGDLSEYNLLYYKKDIWIIDVSQSVEIDHPNALHFLRSDCKNVTDYFSKWVS